MKPRAVQHSCGCEKFYVFEAPHGDHAILVMSLEEKPCSDCKVSGAVGRTPKEYNGALKETVWLAYRDGFSDKFWTIRQDGKKQWVSWGRIGTKGQSLSRSFKTTQRQNDEAWKQIDSKLDKGYYIVARKKTVDRRELTDYLAGMDHRPSLAGISYGDEVGRRRKSAEPTRALSLHAPVWASDVLKRQAEAKGKSVSAMLSSMVQRQAKRLSREATPRKPRVICDPSRPVCSYSLDGGLCTVEAPLVVPARSGGIGIEKIPSRYCLIEIDDLLTSHSPLTGFGERPGYPQGAQERDYRLPLEQAKVAAIAEHYEPSLVFNTAPGAIDGVPVVSESKVVLGGNGRTMATTLVYHGMGSMLGSELREYIIDHAIQFGFTKAQVRKFQRPMVVRTIRVANDPKTLAEWSRRLNMSLSQQLDATRMAVSRARFLDPRALEDLAMMDETETMASYLSSNRSQGLIRSLQHSGILDARSSAQYLQNGMLTAAGKDMINDLLVAVIIPDAPIITSLGAGTVATLARSSPYLLATKQYGAYDVTVPLQKALRDLISFRDKGVPTVKDFYRQGGLFSSSKTETEGDPLAMKWLEVLVEGGLSAAKFAKMSRAYLKFAKEGVTGQSGFFAVKKLTPLQALQQAAEDAQIFKKGMGSAKAQGSLIGGVPRYHQKSKKKSAPRRSSGPKGLPSLRMIALPPASRR